MPIASQIIGIGSVAHRKRLERSVIGYFPCIEFAIHAGDQYVLARPAQAFNTTIIYGHRDSSPTLLGRIGHIYSCIGTQRNDALGGDGQFLAG